MLRDWVRQMNQGRRLTHKLGARRLTNWEEGRWRNREVLYWGSRHWWWRRSVMKISPVLFRYRFWIIRPDTLVKERRWRIALMLLFVPIKRRDLTKYTALTQSVHKRQLNQKFSRTKKLNRKKSNQWSRFEKNVKKLTCYSLLLEILTTLLVSTHSSPSFKTPFGNRRPKCQLNYQLWNWRKESFTNE